MERNKPMIWGASVVSISNNRMYIYIQFTPQGNFLDDNVYMSVDVTS